MVASVFALFFSESSQTPGLFASGAGGIDSGKSLLTPQARHRQSDGHTYRRKNDLSREAFPTERLLKCSVAVCSKRPKNA